MSVNIINNLQNKSQSQTASFLVSLLLGLISLFVLNMALAGPGESQYKAAQIPNTQSCSVGRDLLSEEATYDKTDITGALPYTRHYETTLADNQNRHNDMTNGQKSIGGWTDNYNNYVFVAASSNGNAVMRLRLPGDKDDTYYILNTNTGVVQRILSPTPLEFEANYTATGSGSHNGRDRIGTMSTDHRDRPLGMFRTSSDLTALSFYVRNHGTLYNFKYQTTRDGVAVYKMTTVVYPDGRILGLSYENYGGIGLISVADNRGHLLTLDRDDPYMDGNAVRSVVKSVTLTAQNGYPAFPDQQKVTYTYKISNWINFLNGLNERFYTISSATSNLYGTETYQYNHNAALAPAYANGVQYYSEPYQVPVLTDVLNADNISQLHWNYEKPYNTWTGLKESFKPLTSRNVLYLKRKYGGGVTNQNAAWSNNYTYSTDVRLVNTTSEGSINVTGHATSSLVTYNFSGFPCITYNNIPVSKEIIDVRLNNVTDIYDMKGNQTHFTYDNLNRVKTVEEAVGTQQARTTTYTYGPLSNAEPNPYNIPTMIQEPLQTTTNVINPFGRVTQTIKSYPQTGSASQTWQYGYFEDNTKSNYGLLQFVAGPRSVEGTLPDTDWYSYDEFGNVFNHAQLTSNTNANTPPIERTALYRNYNSAGLPQTFTDFDGSTDQIAYDATYQVLGKIHTSGSDSQTTSNTYNALGQRDKSVDADNKVTKYDYDSLGRISVQTYPNGNKEVYTYHPNSVINSKIQKSLNGTDVASYFQDVDWTGRVAYTRLGTLNSLYKNITYDDNGNVIQTTTAANIINKWSYDALNRVFSHTDGNGFVDTKSFDHANNNIDETASNNTGSSRTFRNRNILKSEQNADFGSKIYSYDRDNNLTSKVHIDRQCYYGKYDQLERPQYTKCLSSDGTDPYLQVNDIFSYDQTAFGNLDKVTGRFSGHGVNTSYLYDSFHRIASKTQNNFASTSLTVGYDYTSAGRLKSVTYPTGNQVAYNYDANGVLNNIKLNNNDLVTSIVYDGANRFRGFNWGATSASFGITINDQNLIKAIYNANVSGANNFNVIYGHDLDGRIKTQKVGSTVTNYNYDNNSQLLSENAPSLSQYINYSYDNNGNRYAVESTGVAGNSSFGVATGSSATCAFVSSAYADYYPDLKATFGYNAVQLKDHWLNFGMPEGRTPCGSIYPTCIFNANLYVSLWPDLVTGGVNGTNHYKNFGVNEGRGICPASSNTNSTSVARFGFNANHFSAWQKNGNYLTVGLSNQGELNSTYVGTAIYDYAGRRRSESSVPGSSVYTGTYFDYNHKNERTFRGGSNLDRQYAYDESSHLIGEYTIAGDLVVEYIWLGDRPIAAVYPGNVVVYIATDHQNKPRRGINAATQQVVWSWDPDAYGVIQPSGSVTINLRFPGQYYDVQSGLYYNHNRYYNPELGRYMEPDPIGLKGGLNPYAYAGNDPVNKTDPSGLCFGPLFVPCAIQAGRMVYLNAPRIAAAIEGLSPAAAGSVGAAAGTVKGAEKWASTVLDHPAGFNNARFGKEITQWGKKPEGVIERLKSPVTADDVQRAKNAGYTEKHFEGWRDRYLETATKTEHSRIDTPTNRATLMQNFIDAWRK